MGRLIVGREEFDSLESRVDVVETTLYNCSVSVQLLDAVFIDAADSVDRANSSSISTMPVIGIVTEKPTSTTCKVQRNGAIAGFSGLTVKEAVFVDTSDGGISTTIPIASNAIKQKIGIAKDTNEIQLEIGAIEIKNAQDYNATLEI